MRPLLRLHPARATGRRRPPAKRPGRGGEGLAAARARRRGYRDHSRSRYPAQHHAPAHARGCRHALPPADAVLRRLIQNQLMVQEGYRMGLQDQLAVRNQVIEAGGPGASEALLDSVANTAPTDGRGSAEARREQGQGLHRGADGVYEVTVDSTLLRSLDYATSDEEALEALRENDAVLAVVPSGPIKVKNLSRSIRFQEYHGLADKPDAVERRDRIFYELLVESLVRYEARRLGFDERPEIRRLIAQPRATARARGGLERAAGHRIRTDRRRGAGLLRAAPRRVHPRMKIKLDTVKLGTEARREHLPRAPGPGAPR